MLFNTEMVRAILEDRKTVTRRVVKPQPQSKTHPTPFLTPPCRPGNVLYVRETWQYRGACYTGDDCSRNGEYVYKAGFMTAKDIEEPLAWRPSIHMPREAARIFLRVTNVRVERLRDITLEQVAKEGIGLDYGDLQFLENYSETKGHWDILFSFAWDSTLKPKDRPLYGWDANPWVWVISFKRIKKEEAVP